MFAMPRRLEPLLLSLVTWIVAVGAMWSTGHGQQRSDSSVSKQQTGKHAVARPDFRGFSVEITLSDRAKKKLIDSKETVVVIGFFTGSPRQGVPLTQYEKYLSRPGPIGLADVEVEVPPGKIAEFGKIKLNQDALAQIDDQGPQLLINVVSGRKSSEDNLLACDIYEGALTSVQGKSIPIKCKLIRELHGR